MSENTAAARFDGIIVGKEQRRALTRYIRSALGESNYALAADFFASIWRSPARYKVFLARRCLNLMYTFYRSEYEVPDPELSSTLYSDGSLLASAPDIAESYLRWGGFPEIIIIDDILIHGRTLNDLIDNLINSVYRYIKQKNGTDERSKVESALLSALTIKVMVQTNKPLLLRSQYYRCLKSKPDKSDIWLPRQWRELSLRISQLIMENIFYNTSYILSLRIKQGALQKEDWKIAAEKLGFRCLEYDGRFSRTVLVKPLKRKNSDIVAFYTIRISNNRVNTDSCIVPFVMMADFACDLGRSLFARNDLMNDLLSDLADGESGERLKAEALYLLLSHNLLLLLLQEMNIKLPTSGAFDVDKINIAFKSSTSNKNGKESFPKRVSELTKPFMNWDEMNELILNATDESKPLFGRTSEGTSQDYVATIEDIIAEEGRIMEKNAFLEYSEGIFSPSRAGKQPLTELFAKLSQKLSIKDIDLSALVGKLLELMDMGSTAINTKKSDKSGRDFIICGYRPGEQSLFILPKRYAQDLPVLIEIERNCYSRLGAINKRVNALYKDTPERASEINGFIMGLYGSGQRLIDWDINMLLWSDITDDIKNKFSGADSDFLLTAQMIFNISKRSELMDRYRELYPENQ